FFELLPDVHGLTGLDVGCGEGYNTRLLAKRGAAVFAVDIAPAFVRAAAEAGGGVRYAVAGGQRLPVRGAAFDFVVATMSFMDIPQPALALREAARVLKQGGFLQFSITHPCFDTPHRRRVRDSAGRTYALEVGGYFQDTNGQVDEWIFRSAPPEVT